MQNTAESSDRLVVAEGLSVPGGQEEYNPYEEIKVCLGYCVHACACVTLLLSGLREYKCCAKLAIEFHC